MTVGFRIGYDWSRERKSACSNLPSASAHPEVVQQSLDQEVASGRLLGPFQPDELCPPVHVSRFGVIEKKHQQGKFRIIVDLSFPEGKSINDGIATELCSLSYTRVDDVVKGICQLGSGTLMAKIDIKSAYRIVPVHPVDRHLLATSWNGQLYVDGALPFGLRSAPKIFTALADAFEFIMKQHGIEWVWHYLDDFITIGPPATTKCAAALDIMLALSDLLGIPLATDKIEGPACVITFLGITLDAVQMELRLPEEKIERLKSLIEEWSPKRWCRKRDLESLIGQLHHASTVVKPGRSFTRRMIDLCKSVHRRDRPIRLNKSFHSDLAWWRLFLTQWNGVAMMPTLTNKRPEYTVTSDASGSWGCGAFCDNLWLQIPWSDSTALLSQSIAVKEMIPIIASCVVWGHDWRGKHILAKSDNESAVHVIKRRSCKDETLMHMLRCLFFIEALFGFTLVAEHIPGAHNELADAISRNHATLFLSKVPGACRTPTSVPQELLEILIHQQPDWTSLNWTALFTSILEKV